MNNNKTQMLNTDNNFKNRLLTSKEVMSYLSISKPTFFRWIKTDVLKAKKIGGLIRVEEKDLLDFLQMEEL